jgi:uncharacterized membrane protein
MIEMSTPLCQLCERKQATYVCQSCGSTVCSDCFDPRVWSCSNCAPKSIAPVGGRTVFPHFTIGSWLFFLAFALIIVGMLLMTLGSLGSSNGGFSGGAVILIGPIPIILGTGPFSAPLIAVAAVLTLVVLVFFLFLRRRAQR